ncbi:MAG: radical SAM family heme chaperone HemW [Bacteroidales bacterium]
MGGMYIHVPFCRQACRYCDFYFTVSLKYRDSYVASLLTELIRRKDSRDTGEIDTIYLGGGTPSVLTEEQLEMIMGTIRKHYRVRKDAEITIEANPDDLKEDYPGMLRRSGFNRLSIGVQSFQEKDLELMRRSHTAEQAVKCMELAHSKGFENISMDLIYGVPGLTLGEWEENVRITMKQPIGHISAYHLTYEPGTVFHHWKKKGRLKELPEQTSIEQYRLLREITAENGFEHYEISNFAKKGFRSKHNSTYWSGVNYLGFGPSAHSYNGTERRWNIASLKGYIEKVNGGGIYYESEQLTSTEKYHDYLITSLRTVSGADTDHIESVFGIEILNDLLGKVQKFMGSNDLLMQEGILKMTPEGWLKSDMIIGELML